MANDYGSILRNKQITAICITAFIFEIQKLRQSALRLYFGTLKNNG